MATEPSPPDAPPIRGGPWGAAGVLLCASSGLGILGITALGRVDRAPGELLAHALLVLPFLYAGWLAVVFAVWCALPDRRDLPVLGVLGLGVMGVLWGPSMARWTDDAPGEPVTAMTWNLRRLWGARGDGGDALACVVRTIREADPQVLALTEVSRENLAQLEPALGMTCVHGTYQDSGSDRKGGLAACGRGVWRATSGDVVRFDDDEDWNYVMAELTDGARVLNVLAVHLTPFHRGDLRRSVSGQANQTAALLDRVARFHDPTVVAGDFNSTRDFYLHGALRGHLQDAWERGGIGPGATRWLSGVLPLRIDYVYASDAFAVRAARVPGDGCSDHLPVVAELVLRDR